MSNKVKKLWTSAELEDRISFRFCPPAYAFLPQVRNGTGFARQVRTADAIAMSLYSSRGLDLNGFEIKVHRGDWLTELKRPEKAEEIASFCDYWWIIAPKEIIKVEEIPKNWGFMIPFGKDLKIIKQAEKLKPKNIDKLFLAGILRKTQEVLTPDAKLLKKYKDGITEGKRKAQENFKWTEKRHGELQKKVSDFEKTSGVNITSWQGGEIGKAVNQVLTGEHTRIKRHMEILLKDAKAIVKSIEENLRR